MAQVTVDFEDYRSGSLPDVCVFTGSPASARMVFRTRIREPTSAVKPLGPFLRLFSRALSIEDPRKPLYVLVGRLPVDAAHLRRLTREQRLFHVVRWAGALLMLIAALAAAPWSPVVVVGSFAAIVFAGFRSSGLRRGLPLPTLIGAGSKVYLDNVHEAFVAAVESGRYGAPPGG
jgi:hypothetical protein